MSSLLKIDMSNAVDANVMVSNKPELGARNYTLHKLGSGVHIGYRLDGAYGWGSRGMGGGGVLGGSLEPVGIQVHGASTQASLGIRYRGMGMDTQGCPEAQNKNRAHFLDL